METKTKIFIQELGYRTPSNANWSYRYYALLTETGYESNNSLDLHHVISIPYGDYMQIANIVEELGFTPVKIRNYLSNTVKEKDFNKAWFTSDASTADIIKIIVDVKKSLHN